MSDKLTKTISDIQKKYGKDVYVEKTENNYTVIPSGSAIFDKATGIGGYALGKFVEIYSWEGCGKSTIALHLIAEAQKLNMKCALLDSECSYDFTYGANLGVNQDELEIFEPEIVEDAANITCDLINSDEVQVIIIDSLSALSTAKEKEGDVGDSNMGVKARLIGQFCRKIKNLIAKKNVLVVVIGQLREKMVMYGSPNTTDYGNAVKFFADVRIELSKKLEKDGDEVVGNRVTAKFIKNKLGKPFQECEFVITFGIGFDTVGDLFTTARNLPKEVYNKRGETTTYNGEKYKSSDFEQLVRDNQAFQDEFAKTIRENGTKD